MCYSALVEAGLKKLGIKFKARMDMALFDELFRRRSEGENIKVARGLEANFLHPANAEEKKLKTYIDRFTAVQMKELEQLLFSSKKRLADAERKLKAKHTKTAEKEIGIAERKIESCKKKLDQLKSTKVTREDSRIYSMSYAPVIVQSHGERLIVPMRYLLRPSGMKEDFDRKYPGCYNARRDSLDGFWKKQFGRNHAILVISEFYEHVKRHDYENRALRKGEKEENMILRFAPEGRDYMIVPCIWDHWGGKGDDGFDSFALITDEPPAEVAATGHDRCPIFLREENIDAWLSPGGKSREELFALLDDRERPVYRHEVAA